MTSYVVVEGHGEQQAVISLLVRLGSDLGLAPRAWAPAIRGRSLLTSEGICRYAEYVRPRADAEALLILADDDDGCPRDDAPRLATALRRINLPFPTALVLAYREYETLFLPCIADMAGKPLAGTGGFDRPGLVANARWEGAFEAKRDVKGWLTSQMPPGRAYKPRLDQLPMTRLVNFARVRDAGLPWFGSLENALRFLDASEPGQVYPRAYGSFA